MHALVAAGADVIELGVPFSDPMADGPVIQRASRACACAARRPEGRARDGGVVSREGRGDAGRADGLRESDRGDGRTSRFADRARAAGVDGVLVVDYPPEEAADFAALLGEHDLAPIFLLVTDDAGRSHRDDRAARARLCLLRVAQGRDRRRASRHRGGRAQARRDPPPRDASRRRGLRHSRCRERARDRARRRRGGHRQPPHPGDRGGRRRKALRRAPARGSRASAARSISTRSRRPRRMRARSPSPDPPRASAMAPPGPTGSRETPR